MEDDDLPEPTMRDRVRSFARDAALTVLFGVAALVVVGWLRAPSLPARAPPFTLRSLDGPEVSLASFAGKTVVINFWATWCGPCRLEAPTLASFSEAHPDIVVLGIAEDKDAAALKRAAHDLGISYPVLFGTREVLETYGIGTFPTTVFVAPDGTVRWTHTGLLLRPQLAWTAGVLW